MSVVDLHPIEATPNRATRAPLQRRVPWGSHAMLLPIAAVIGVGIRLWLAAGLAPSWWQDSYDYDAVGSNSVPSKALWIGDRPPLMPLLLGASGGEPGDGLILAQVVTAGVCWAWLATELSMWVRHRWAAVAIVVSVMAFSLSDPIVMWDVQVLTESLTLSLMAATAAAALRFGASRSWPAGAALVAMAAAWCLTRDTVAVAVLVASLAAMVGWRRQRAVVAVAGSLLLVATVTMTMASSAGRGDVPASHVFFARVLPFPERLEWFEGRGMPRVEAFHAAVAPAEGPHVVGVPEDAVEFEPWWDWFNREGPATWRAYVAMHPWYLIAEPMREPERVYNNGEGSITTYRPAELSKVPAATAVMWPSLFAAIVGLIAGGAMVVRRWWWSEPVAVAALMVLGASAYVVVAWHSDAMESARHVFIGGVMARLALLILLAGLIEPLRVALRRRPDI